MVYYKRRTWDVNKNISRIRYNYLNLPEELQTRQGHKTLYTYSASGVKLRVEHTTAKAEIQVPVSDIRALAGNEILSRIETDYEGNKIYENGQLKLVLTPEGYLAYDQDNTVQEWGAPESYNWYYYYNLRDHLGSNRVTLQKDGNSLSISGKTAIAGEIEAYSRQFLFDKSIIKPECPQWNNIPISDFYIVFYHKSILHSFNLFLSFAFSTDLKCKVIH